MTTTLQSPRLALVELGRSYPSSDRRAVQQIGRQMLRLLDDPSMGALVVDLTKTEFFGAALLGVLLRVTREAQETGREVVLCGVGEHAANLLRLTRLDKVWQLYPTRRSALRELGVMRPHQTLIA